MEARGAARILIVDDEPEVRSALRRVLVRAGYECETAASVSAARAALGTNRVALALCDLRLPGESGLELLRHLAAEHSHVAAVAITGRAEPRLASRLLELGSDGFLIKPFTPGELLIAVQRALVRRRRGLERRTGHRELGRVIPYRRRAPAAPRGRSDEREIEAAGPVDEVIACLARAVELRGGEAGGHSEAVGAYCGLIAHRLGLPAERCDLIRAASQLHDIGKLAIPDSVLLKQGALTAEERAVVQRHAEVGHEILSASASELLRVAATIALTHHERFDGLGYPRGLEGEAIPLEGRITAVADVFDALTSDRPYRSAVPLDEAKARIRAEAGAAFDPAVVDALLESLDEALAPRRTDGTEPGQRPSAYRDS